MGRKSPVKEMESENTDRTAVASWKPRIKHYKKKDVIKPCCIYQEVRSNKEQEMSRKYDIGQLMDSFRRVLPGNVRLQWLKDEWKRRCWGRKYLGRFPFKSPDCRDGERRILCDFTHMWDLKVSNTNEQIEQKQTHRFTEQIGSPEGKEAEGLAEIGAGGQLYGDGRYWAYSGGDFVAYTVVELQCVTPDTDTIFF